MRLVKLFAIRFLRNNVRMMRTPPVIAALFPDIRARVLAAAFAHPEKQWYLSELAGFLETRSSSLQREVDALSKAGILEQRRDGRRVYLKPDTRCPVFADLKGLFEKTTGMLPVLRAILEPFGDKVLLAWVYGSIARSEEGSESDVDLLTVGSLGLADLLPALRRAEQALARPVNPTVFSLQEFTRRARARHHFLSAVLDSPKQFVKGSEHELEAIVG